jgi:hypothetical protein
MTDQLSDREARADPCFEQDLKGQRECSGLLATARPGLPIAMAENA